MKCFKYLAATLLISMAPCFGEPIRIDLGMATGRNDTATPGWHEWQIPNGPQAEREFDGVTVKLSSPNGGVIEGQWYKAGLATGATMATDGVVAPAIEVTFLGLKPGRHTLVTYHNALSGGGVNKFLMEMPTSKVEVTPSSRVATNEEAESVYLEFEVEGSEPVVIQLATAGNQVVLNGLEIDGTNPKAKSLRPFPADGDGHADGESGSLVLQWQAAASASKHHVYFASATDGEEAKQLVAAAKLDSPEYLGLAKSPSTT